ncbi:MAG: hypothetical protein GX020_08835 [Firmicutes bacterium]|nr:hypothetical protein [Bacillota bacterium]
MTKSPNKIKDWLEQQKNRVIKISKEENGDFDSAKMKLKDVDFVRHQDTEDYLSAQSLVLLGEGTIETDFGNEELPSQTFEIALTDSWFSAIDERGLHLRTERGNYEIELELNPYETNDSP